MSTEQSSPAEAGDNTDSFIKETDDAHINLQMGVGACALHPCLTRRMTDELEEAPGAVEIPSANNSGENESVGASSTAVAEETAGASMLDGSPNLDRGERELADLLARHCHTHGSAPEEEAAKGAEVERAQAQPVKAARVLLRAGAAQPDSPGEAAAVAVAAAHRRKMERAMAGMRVEGAAGGGGGAETPTVELVQTAVSVREVSKLIGRTVVQVSNVRRIMIVTKPNDTSLVSLTRDLALWLLERGGNGNGNEADSAGDPPDPPMVVYIEEFIARHRSFNMARVRQRSAAVAAGGLQHWTAELCARSPELFDFVVTLGGDGTVLYTSWLFQRTVPPIIPFHLGSLGFLTVFDHRHARRVLDSAMRAGVRVNLRMRFTCTVYRLAEAVDPQHANVLVDAADCNRVIDRALATSGLQSCDEHGPRADHWAARTEHRPARTDHKAARSDHRAARTDHAAPPRPVRSFSSGGGGGGGGGGGARRRSSASPGGNGNGNGDNGGDGSSSEGGSGGRQPQLSSRSSSTRRRQQQQQQARAGAAPASKPPPAPTPKPPPVAARAPTLNESEWDDVPRAYQQRVRSVWKRDSTFQVMNEVVMDRGPSPYLSKIELYGDGNHLTTVEADGLCLATPTGSTAYSLAAGGSLVHPEIPAILVTPICAHTLSFRPMLLPDSMVVRVVLPPDSRNTAWASFDGRHRIELRRGDHIQITASKYPLPTVCASQSQTQDWMASLSRCLNWNERKRQKTLAGSNDADGPDSMLPPGAAPSDGEIGDDDDEAGEGDALSS